MNKTSLPTLKGAAIAVLTASGSDAKAASVDQAMTVLKNGAAPFAPSDPQVPDEPARPTKPKLVDPIATPRRGFGTIKGRAALLHAIAHIEFNAIDLAFDMVARFGGEIASIGLDVETFYNDWFRVGADEARHFRLIEARLHTLGFRYGDFSAHRGLWDAAASTARNLRGRLVIAPLILEARGLDVTPGMIARLRENGDDQSADLLGIILDEEISHVSCGKRWFDAVCQHFGDDPLESFKAMEVKYFKGRQKPPFNHDARQAAGLERVFYERN